MRDLAFDAWAPRMQKRQASLKVPAAGEYRGQTGVRLSCLEQGFIVPMSLGGRTSRAAREHAGAIGRDRTPPECGTCGTISSFTWPSAACVMWKWATVNDAGQLGQVWVKWVRSAEQV